jgi:hypothetical protein
MMDIRRQLEEALGRGDPALFRECAAAIEDAQLGESSFDDAHLVTVLDAVKDPRFLGATGSWRLLLVIDLDSEKLSGTQRTRVLSALTEAYSRFVDASACFQITELIGKRFADVEGLAALITFGQSADDVRRSYAAHGLGDVVTAADDETVRASALGRLIAMHDDPAERVRYEVALALRRLLKRGHDEVAVTTTLNSLRNDESSSVRSAATS